MVLLSQALPELCSSIRFTKSMRWNQSGTAFSRPVRWLVALLGEDVIPFSFAGLKSGRKTWGLRFSEEPSKDLRDAADYFRLSAFPRNSARP